jgi:flagellar protein FlaG
MDTSVLSQIQQKSLAPAGYAVDNGSGNSPSVQNSSAAIKTAPAPIAASNKSNDAALSDSGQHKDQNAEKYAEALKSVNNIFQKDNRTVQFTLNQDAHRMVIQIKDTESGKVIRQIPAEESLQLAKRLDDFKGMMYEDKA